MTMRPAPARAAGDEPAPKSERRARRSDEVARPRAAERLRSLRDALRAARHGDFSIRLPVDGREHSLSGEVALAFNSLVEQNDALTHELHRMSRAVGLEGRTGERATLGPATGSWATAVDSVNALVEAMTFPTTEATRVLRLVSEGDLSREMAVHLGGQPLEGDFFELATIINAVVRRLRSVSTSVSRVVREIGVDGRLGGKESSESLSGTWRDLVDDVNLLSDNLTAQVRNIALVSTAIAKGDLSQKITVETRGEILDLKNTINTSVDQLRSFAAEVIRVAREVGTEGKLGAQADVRGVSGVWQELTDSVNRLASNLTSQVRNIALVSTAIATGDLSQKITVEAKGEILELKNTINTMVEQLRSFASEVTRVAREVGTEGKLGGQANVPGVSGTWKNLTDNVNLMASNLTDQVRGIAKVVTAVADGDLSQKFVVEAKGEIAAVATRDLSKKLVVAAKGEIAALADTINNMTDTLRTFAEQVTTVAREVGIEGKLGGQAKVPGASGTWRDLVDNVNQLAGNLTTQVRAISEVAGAVTKGDLTRTIDVEALGEVLGLKDTINQMIANLRDTTRTNKEQDWLKSNLAKFSGMMQGQRSLESLGQLIMSELTPVVSAHLGTFFVTDSDEERPMLKLLSSYGYTRRKSLSNRFALGEGLVGQSALEKKTILVTHVPDDYVAVSSSLGEAVARSIVVLPIVFEGQVRGVIELGSFEPFSAIHLTFLEQLALSIGVVFNMISASRRTEELLEELRRSNAELERRSSELEDKARLLELRNREIADASANLEEKAKQLALVSKYKSEFLANMSHELRTPLNSVIILANMLAENGEKNLTRQQVEYGRTILSSGRDLLALINQILDLSKIEAGKMEIERRRVALGEIRAYAERHFQPIANQKGIRFTTTITPDAPPTVSTDPQRLQQILKNLLSNAFKFTEAGSVEMQILVEPDTQALHGQALRRAPAALAFAIADTGIGIPHDKQQIIFEAFQQADASTSRVYGGTGLGLTISRELARLLGGEIHLKSKPSAGSTFTLYVPLTPDDRAPLPPVLDPHEDGEVKGFEEVHTPALAPPVRAITQLGAPEAEAPSELLNKKILVVDDDVRNLFAVTSLLERRGIAVLPAAGARESFEALEKHHDVALVLMDLMMPEIDGYEATRRLRRDPRWHAVPIVALTAKAMPGDRERALEAGCDDFVPKPVEQDRLFAVLAEWITKERPA